MKRIFFVSTFIVAHVGFIFLQIHKHAQFIQASYRKQKNEQLLAKLNHEKEQRVQKLYALQNKDQIKQYAQHHLAMSSVKLNQIKKISDDKSEIQN
ncbi:MAG TPA: hypothetical protein PLU71_05130 [Candidatus Dependentiae bacterium]|nr:hypothetical protein [Candidatus Dependentiae bacterium]HRQ63218.1 hypothetical protein [Candidatus Dependentiae bacterium]